MESGEITSDQIMASSQYNPSWSPERSRLNYYENAWTPAEDTNKEWIQVPYCSSHPSFSVSQFNPPAHTNAWTHKLIYRLCHIFVFVSLSAQSNHHPQGEHHVGSLRNYFFHPMTQNTAVNQSSTIHDHFNYKLTALKMDRMFWRFFFPPYVVLQSLVHC